MSTDEQEITFEKALVSLEKIVSDLERGNLDLTSSLKAYENGVALFARCQSLLDGIDRSVALLTGVDADGNPIAAPFDASATIGPEAIKPAPKARTRKTTIVETPVEPSEDLDLPF
jgi:exodeoxyribonuclease VII small subunit